MSELALFSTNALQALVNGLWVGTLLVVVVAVILRFFKPMTASTRYVAWTSVLLLAVLMPLVFGRLSSHPSHSASLAIPAGEWSSETRQDSLPAAEESSTGMRGEIPAPAAVSTWLNRMRTPVLKPVRLPVSGWYSVLLAAWIGLSGLLVLRLGTALFKLRQFRINGSPADPALLTIVERFRRIHRCHQDIQILLSDGLSIPITTGFFRPVIVLPEKLAGRLTDQEMELVILHELAHIHRHDLWTNLFYRLVQCVFFFHPAVWWITRQLEIEREIACDDQVIRWTKTPVRYARCLTAIAGMSRESRIPVVVPAAVFSQNTLVRRVIMIMNSKRRRAAGVSRLGVILVILLGSVALLQCAQMSSQREAVGADPHAQAPAPPVLSVSLVIPDEPAPPTPPPKKAPPPPKPAPSPEPDPTPMPQPAPAPAPVPLTKEAIEFKIQEAILQLEKETLMVEKHLAEAVVKMKEAEKEMQARAVEMNQVSLEQLEAKMEKLGKEIELKVEKQLKILEKEENLNREESLKAKQLSTVLNAEIQTLSRELSELAKQMEALAGRDVVKELEKAVVEMKKAREEMKQSLKEMKAR